MEMQMKDNKNELWDNKNETAMGTDLSAEIIGTGAREDRIHVIGRKKRRDNRGIGVVEIILILVVLIGLVIIFQSQIREVVNNALTNISDGAGQISL